MEGSAETSAVGTVATSGMGTGTATAEPAVVKTTFRFGQEMPEEKQAFEKFVPEEFQNEEFVKNIAKSDNPRVELFKQWKEREKLIGAKPVGIIPPGADATKEQIDTWNKSLGIPDTIEGYEITSIDWGEDKEIGDKIEASRDPELVKEMKQAAKDSGMTPKQFQSMLERYEKVLLKNAKAYPEKQKEAIKKLNDDFDKEMSKKFGGQMQKVRTVGQNLITQLGDSDDKAVLGTLSNIQLTGLASLLYKIHQTYIREDGFSTSGNASFGNGNGDLAEGRRLMASEAFQNLTHPDHADVRRRVEAIYGTGG